MVHAFVVYLSKTSSVCHNLDSFDYASDLAPVVDHQVIVQFFLFLNRYRHTYIDMFSGSDVDYPVLRAFSLVIIGP